MIRETEIGNSGITPERKKVSDMKPEELDRFLEVEEALQRMIVRPMQNREEWRGADREVEENTVWQEDVDDDYEDPMKYLQRARPDRAGLAMEYYAMETMASLASEEVRVRFRSLDEDGYNIADKIDMYGEQAYRDVIQAVRESVETRKSLAAEVYSSFQMVGEDSFRRYCYKIIQETGNPNSELQELFKTYYQGMNLDSLSGESYEMLEGFRDILKSIDTEEVLEFMRNEATKKQRSETRVRKEEKIRRRKDLAETLERFRDDHVLFSLIRRMNIKAVDGGEIRNSQMIRGLPYDVLKKLSDKAEQLAELAEQYGVSIDWYKSGDMEFLLEELFSEGR